MRLDALFAHALEQQRLRPLDVAFARFLAEHDADIAPALPWLAALLSRQLADGHLCLDLTALPALAQEQDWPEHWRALADTLHDGDALHLPASPLLATGDDGEPADAPLVLDGTRLYLRRYWNHERQVAQGILDRVTCAETPVAHFADELARLFPDTASPDWQRIACALAARGRFGVITGGPGTGKTTTVVRLLGLLQTLHLREHARPLRIRLAAPTGKAAARLNASIAAQRAQLDVDDSVRAAIPAQVETLHRLLGARPDTRRFRHDRANPLHLDVLVIDEASMIDLEMMSAVLAALPASARLVLLGDKDQLSSVEAGAVLGDLCRRAPAGHYDQATVQWLRTTTGQDIADWASSDAQPLDQHVAMLRHSHRFGAGSGIGRLAEAVNQGDADAVHARLAEATADLSWQPSATPARLVELAVEGHGENAHGYRHYLQQLQHTRPAPDAGSDAHDAWAHDVLQAFNRFQLLCAVRQGPFGVHELNRLIAAALQARGLVDASHDWYEGRPVMVTRNDYALGLANGDVGICLRLPDAHGTPRLSVVFPDDTTTGTRSRRILPSRLGDVDTVYAMTVHKSQGSEFDHTLLALPTDPSPLLTRELLYTGITRARRHFTLAASQDIVTLATQTRTRRHSGLSHRLSPTP